MVKFFEPQVPSDMAKTTIPKIKMVIEEFNAKHQVPMRPAVVLAMATALYWTLFKYIEDTRQKISEQALIDAYDEGHKKGLEEGIKRGGSRPCKRCNGSGKEQLYQDGYATSWRVCIDCNGHGRA